MTKRETLNFRKALEAKVIDLSDSTRRREAIHIEKQADALDQILGAAERDLAVKSLEAFSVQLKDARAALRRIDEGTYGICRECDDAISPKRLAAMPSATLCLACQEAVDRDRYSDRLSRPVFAMAA